MLAALVALPFLVKNYRVFQSTLVLIYAIALLGLNILTGYNGQFSLGHGAFYAIGAYTAAILMDRFERALLVDAADRGVVCLVAGYLMGFPALRLAGHYPRTGDLRAGARDCRRCSSTRASRAGPAACRVSC